MNIAVIGAGIAGLTAAYRLARAGNRVTVFEAAPQAGGLASGFRDTHWEWHLERFYHHVFETDTNIRHLTNEVGYGANLFFRKGVTAHYWQGNFYPIASPVEVLRFPGVSFVNRVRFGAASFYLKYITRDWHALERIPAITWAKRWMGTPAYRVIMQPLLEGKFGHHANSVNMAWLWARLKARSFKLGYYRGGFQGFVNALVAASERLGVVVQCNSPVQSLHPIENGNGKGNNTGWYVQVDGSRHQVDSVVATVSPQLLTTLTPALPSYYLQHITTLESLGAVVLVLALSQSLTHNLYWTQGMTHADGFPFLTLVEHTNFIESAHYGNDHIIYCGDYVATNHPYFTMSKEELLIRFLPALQKVNPYFSYEWIRKTWLFREPYAQPVVGLNHSTRIPPLATPLRGLYWASMSHVYPWDRGTNFAVALGERVATEVLQLV